MYSGQAHLVAGAAQVDVSPIGSQFLYGYPYVRRYSTGVHDPLLASALYISDGATALLFLACDVIFFSKAMTARVRQRISQRTGIPCRHIMVTASHTHSGPMTVSMLSNQSDPAVPAPDPMYLQQLEDGAVEAAAKAFATARPARLGYATADGAQLGTNRHDINGPARPQVPVLTAHDALDGSLLAVMCIVSMHPTVLHEDWTLVSGDFPGLGRQWFQHHVCNCPVIYHMGGSGNQSPRHRVKGNTIEEAQRLGCLLGQGLQTAVESATPIHASPLGALSAEIDLPPRAMPSLGEATAAAAAALARLETLKQQGADGPAIRTAECDWFGAEETLTLARAAASGDLHTARASCLPAEVQVLRIGDHVFIGWPGEVFVEFATEIQKAHPRAHIITLANGELQGYLVTQEAVDRGYYEAGNALFQSPRSGQLIVEATRQLLQQVLP